MGISRPSPVLGFLRGTAADVASRMLDEEFVRGFHEAAYICVGALDDEIDALMKRMKTGDSLSDREQYLIASLTELKTSLEAKLVAYFDDKIASAE